MDVGEDRLRLGAARKLIFQNFCNGVTKADLAVEFARSATEIGRDIALVAKKIREYRFRRCLQPHPDQGMLPAIACEAEEDIILNRRELCRTLEWIGPETLSTEDLIIPTLTTHQVETMSHFKEAARGVRANIREVS